MKERRGFGSAFSVNNTYNNWRKQMQKEIFDTFQANYRKGVFTIPTTFYFSIDDIKKTVTLDGEGCRIEDGKTVEDADCVCKTSEEMFSRIWNDGYRPGIMDFMGGTIKSNAPQLLQQLLIAFGK
jgi:putative sterol carrier protein